MPSLSEYKKSIADRLSISVEDLTETESKIIEISYNIFSDRLGDMKALEDEVKRLSIESANLRAMMPDRDDEYHGYRGYEDQSENGPESDEIS